MQPHQQSAPAQNYLATLLPFALLALAFIAQLWARPTAISSPAMLEDELWINLPGVQPMYEQPPFQYRLLFRLVVESVANMLGGIGQDYTSGGPLLWQAFLLVSGLSWLLALAGVIFLLHTVGYRSWHACLGAMAFAGAFPVVHAYGYPTHTREDPLAYACMAWGLALWLRGAYVPFVAVGMVGVATRETLLTLAVVHIVTGPWTKLWRRVLLVTPMAFVAVAIRLGLGWEVHSVASSWENLYCWKETLLCLVLALGCLWPQALRALISSPSYGSILLQRLHQTWLYVLPMTLISVILAGVVREMRLIFLVAPWAIVLATAGAVANRLPSHCRTAAVGGAVLLVAVIVGPWLFGDGPLFGNDDALGFYSRPSWFMLAAWHGVAVAWAFWPRSCIVPCRPAPAGKEV